MARTPTTTTRAVVPRRTHPRPARHPRVGVLRRPDAREGYQRMAADPVEDFKVRKQWNDDASSMGYWETVRWRSRAAAGLPVYDHASKPLPVADEVVSPIGYWMHLHYKDTAELRAQQAADRARQADLQARNTVCHGCRKPGSAYAGHVLVGVAGSFQLCPVCVAAAQGPPGRPGGARPAAGDRRDTRGVAAPAPRAMRRHGRDLGGLRRLTTTARFHSPGTNAPPPSTRRGRSHTGPVHRVAYLSGFPGPMS